MMNSKFKAKVVVGLFGSVALIELEENEVNEAGDIVVDGRGDIVKIDIETVSPSIWFDYATGEKTVPEGTYIMTGRMSVDHDIVEYHDVEFEKVKAD